MITRRDMLRAAGTGAVLAAAPTLFATARAAEEPAGGFTLPPLPYPADALEPHIDAATMLLHHDKHHKTYVDNLNKALPGPGKKDLKDLTAVLTDLAAIKDEKARAAVRNNGGGHYNHTLFWNVMAKAGGQPTGDLLKALDASFGGLDGFMKEFKAAALGRFGSGWAWLVPGAKGGKPLAIVTSPNQDNPVMDGKPAPVLGIDVWEHAYYLKYQNRRPEYVDAWFKVVNWDAVAANYAAAMKG